MLVLFYFRLHLCNLLHYSLREISYLYQNALEYNRNSIQIAVKSDDLFLNFLDTLKDNNNHLFIQTIYLSTQLQFENVIQFTE